MKTIILKSFKSILLFLGAVILGIWFLGPLEPAELDTNFDKRVLDKDLDKYLLKIERDFIDITAGVEKRIIWTNTVGHKTPLSIVYIHGFSATSEEIRPVPDNIANILKANLYFTRLTGHGRGSMAMSKSNVKNWMLDVREAIEIGRQIGHKVIVISTSTGSTLTAAAALNPDLSRNIAGLIFVSPNFGINNLLANVLTWPGARWWIPIVAGKMRNSSIRNKQHAKFWTTSYPTVATIPMAALVKVMTQQDVSKIHIPALFYYSLEDKIVKAQSTAEVARKWGGETTIINVIMTEKDDPYSHIIAGNIVSPNQTEYAVDKMVKWIKNLGLRSRKAS